MESNLEHTVVSSFLRGLKYGYFLYINPSQTLEEIQSFCEDRWEGSCIGGNIQEMSIGTDGIFYFPMDNANDIVNVFDYKKGNVSAMIHYLSVRGVDSEKILQTIYESQIGQLYAQTKYIWTLRMNTLSVWDADIENMDDMRENLWNWFDLVFYKHQGGRSYFYNKAYYFLNL